MSGNFLFCFWDSVSHCIWISQIHQDQGHDFQGSSCACLLSASTIGLPYSTCTGLGCLNTGLHTYSARTSPAALSANPVEAIFSCLQSSPHQNPMLLWRALNMHTSFLIWKLEKWQFIIWAFKSEVKDGSVPTVKGRADTMATSSFCCTPQEVDKTSRHCYMPKWNWSLGGKWSCSRLCSQEKDTLVTTTQLQWIP